MVEDKINNIKCTIINTNLKPMDIPPIIFILTGCFPSTTPIYSEEQLNNAYRAVCSFDGVFILKTSNGELYKNLYELYQNNNVSDLF